MNTEEVIIEAIKRGFTYDHITGKIYGIKGDEICSRGNGYVSPAIRINSKRYAFKAHIFAWYYTYDKMPKYQIDHINQIRDDNRILNLRDITHQKNNFNKKEYKGYYKRSNKYVAIIMLNKKQIYLGTFDTEEEAHNAYLEAKKIYHII